MIWDALLLLVACLIMARMAWELLHAYQRGTALIIKVERQYGEEWVNTFLVTFCVGFFLNFILLGIFTYAMISAVLPVLKDVVEITL